MLDLIIRTLLLVSLTALAGAFAFNTLVLRAASLQPLREATMIRRRTWLLLCLTITIVALTLDGFLHFGNEDVPLNTGVLLFTRVGLFTILALNLRGEWQDSKFALFLCALLLLSQSLLGHPMRKSAWLLPVITDWLHLVFVSVWLGGVAYYAGVVVPQVLAQRALVPALGASIAKFSPLAVMSVLVIALTGIIQGAGFVGSFDALFNTDYGRALLLKLSAFVVLIGFGALHQYVIAPQINAWRAQAGTQEDAARRFRVTIAVEALFGIFALAAAAAMTLLPLASTAS